MGADSGQAALAGVGSARPRGEAGSRPAAPSVRLRLIMDAIEEHAEAARSCGRTQLDVDAMTADVDADFYRDEWIKVWRRRTLEHMAAERRLRNAKAELLGVIEKVRKEAKQQ